MTIFITGATAGFGKATATQFAAAGWNCIITGRREDRLRILADELMKQYPIKVFTLCFDIQDRNAVKAALDSLSAEWRNIDVLVNNAGLALGRDSFENASLDDWDTMIDTNVKGLIYVTKALLPLFIERKKGHIINIGSTAGKEVYKEGNGYCATKHAVDALSKAMRIDLLPHHIKVTAVHPGAAETEFSLVRYKGDKEKASAVYDGFKALEAKDIADVIFYAANLPAHVCINELIITCTAQANSFYLQK
ncbi:MAG: SDR family NAD(P)-dependent oxidoreductase [Sphingobacteriia bacterium]|nr:MAG: SDR family NAD(P)-dependent oxidoreductase [Sphingobacteriia bacterium]TAH08980.1 MAG: SDR family NAD(P)-dependent oxidoreductase [Sphingobacteriia bacterium]